MRIFAFSAALLLIISGVQAANIHDLDVGDGVYLQGIFSDELVQVVRIDIENNRVKVKRSEDGTTKWVSPSELISRESSTGNDVARAGIVIGLAVCLLNPDACKENGAGSSGLNNARSSGNNYDQLKGKYLLGFKGQNLEYFTYNGERYNYGVQVDSIMNGWPASRAGLKPEDIIYLVDGKMVKNMEFLLAYINSNTPGSSVKISYMRGDNIYDVFVAPQKYQ